LKERNTSRISQGITFDTKPSEEASETPRAMRAGGEHCLPTTRNFDEIIENQTNLSSDFGNHQPRTSAIRWH